MSVEDRVIALIGEGNPIPDPNDLDRDHLDAAAYLETLEQRSSDMTQMKTKKTRVNAPRSRRMPVLVAALLVTVIVGVGVILANTTGGETPVATQPTPTTQAQPSSTTTIESRLSDVPTWLGLESAGTYQPSLFTLPFAFTVAEDGWETGVDSEAIFALCGPDVEGPVGARSACFRASAVAVFLLDQGSVEETQSYLAAVQGAELTNEEPVSIDGAEGVRFSFTHSLNPHSNPEGGFDGYPYWLHESQEIPLGAEQSVVSIVDVDGTVVTVVYQGRAITEPSAFEANLEEGLAIVDSITWGK